MTTKHDENAAASLGLDVRFVRFVARYGKQTKYCPDGKYPCDLAYRRQKVFLKNLNEIEMTNKKGGMKKRVTRFADLENEEFARDHATYEMRRCRWRIKKPATTLLRWADVGDQKKETRTP